MLYANVFETISRVTIDFSIDLADRIDGSGGEGFDKYLCYTPNTLQTLNTFRTLRILYTLNYAFPHRLSAGVCIPVRVRDHGHVRTDLEVSQNITRRRSHGRLWW